MIRATKKSSATKNKWWFALSKIPPKDFMKTLYSPPYLAWNWNLSESLNSKTIPCVRLNSILFFTLVYMFLFLVLVFLFLLLLVLLLLLLLIPLLIVLLVYMGILHWFLLFLLLLILLVLLHAILFLLPFLTNTHYWSVIKMRLQIGTLHILTNSLILISTTTGHQPLSLHFLLLLCLNGPARCSITPAPLV